MEEKDMQHLLEEVERQAKEVHELYRDHVRERTLLRIKRTFIFVMVGCVLFLGSYGAWQYYKIIKSITDQFPG